MVSREDDVRETAQAQVAFAMLSKSHFLAWHLEQAYRKNAPRKFTAKELSIWLHEITEDPRAAISEVEQYAEQFGVDLRGKKTTVEDARKLIESCEPLYLDGITASRTGVQDAIKLTLLGCITEETADGNFIFRTHTRETYILSPTSSWMLHKLATPGWKEGGI